MLLEEDLTKLLETSNPIYKKELNQHLQLYNYGNYWGKHDYFTGYIYNGDPVYDPSPTVRIILFLCGEELCAISHQKPIIYTAWKRAKSHRGLSLLFLKNFPKERYNEFIDWYNKSFLWAD